MMDSQNVDHGPRDRTPDVFTMNGKGPPRTIHPEEGSPIIVDSGGTVRLHLANSGYRSHPVYLHNTATDSSPKTAGPFRCSPSGPTAQPGSRPNRTVSGPESGRYRL